MPLLALGVISLFVFRLRVGPLTLGIVLGLFFLTLLGVAAFLLGRAHAKARHDQKRD